MSSLKQLLLLFLSLILISPLIFYLSMGTKSPQLQYIQNNINHPPKHWIFFYKLHTYHKEDEAVRNYDCPDGDSVLLTVDEKYRSSADAFVFRLDYGQQACGEFRNEFTAGKIGKYIVESVEPPYCLDSYEDFPHEYIDVVGTYRLDCGVTPLQSIFAWMSVDNGLLEGMKKEIDFDLKDDSVPVFWAAKNCNTRNGREFYFKKLAQHIGVSSYGKCMNNAPSLPNWSRDVTKYVHPKEWADKHYFYFAAENSNCKDYVTEKYWKTLASGLIPIVDGPDDYSEFLPSEKSVIRMDEYTPEELAEYLKYLVSNRTAYLEYMPWKTDPNFTYKRSFVELTSNGLQAGSAKRACEIKDILKYGKKAVSCAPTKQSQCVHGKWNKYKT